MIGPDPEVVLKRGMACTELLNNATFLSVIDEVSNFHLTAMIRSPAGPSGADAREYHHTLHTAVAEIGQQVQMWAQAADQLQAFLDADADKDPELDD